MKKGIFLLVTLLSLTSVFAFNTNKNNIGVNYRYNDAVTFTERGVQFHVFLNGQFDFNTLNRRNNFYIRKDRFGRVKQIGNTIINYGYNGNVIGIGNIPVRYQFGQLSSVGNLVVTYDRWGYANYKGFVKQNRFQNNALNVNLGTVCNYNDAYFYDRHFRNNYRQFREDANFFYYRAIPSARIGNRNKVLKRRKPIKNNVKPNKYTKNSRKNNSTTRKITKGSSRRTR